MVSFFGSSRKSPLSESGRDDWSVGSIMGKSLRDDDEVKRFRRNKTKKPEHRLPLPRSIHLEGDRVVDSIGDLRNDDDDDDDDVKRTRHSSKNNKPRRRLPHSLRLDNDRVVYSFCDLHSIPEDQAVCQYRQVTTGPTRRQRARALTEEELHKIVRQVLFFERLACINQIPWQPGMETWQQWMLREWVPDDHALKLKGKQRREVLNSEQFHEVLFYTLVKQRWEHEAKQKRRRNYLMIDQKATTTTTRQRAIY